MGGQEGRARDYRGAGKGGRKGGHGEGSLSFLTWGRGLCQSSFHDHSFCCPISFSALSVGIICFTMKMICKAKCKTHIARHHLCFMSNWIHAQRKTLLKRESETRNDRKTSFPYSFFSFWILYCALQYLINNIFTLISHFKVNLPNSCYNKSSRGNGYQGRIPNIIIFNSMIPFQIENAVKCNGQADKQQGTPKEEPTVEKKWYQDWRHLANQQAS